MVRTVVLFWISILDEIQGDTGVATQALLAEYHNIFSLEPGQLGCTDLVKHEIRVVDKRVAQPSMW